MKTLQTHDGIFHPDEILAINIYEIFTGEEVKVIRSRDKDKMEEVDLVFDVGEKYDRKKYFDHHQPTGVPKYKNGILFSTVGMILSAFCKDKGLSTYLLNNGLYAVQAIDNGQKFFNTIDKKKEKVSNMPNPFQFIKKLNCTWKDGVCSEKQNAAFAHTKDICKSILNSMIDHYYTYLEAQDLVKKTIQDSFIDNRDYIILDRYMPYEKAVIEYNNEKIENIIAKKGTIADLIDEEKKEIIKFCIFKDEKGEWNVWTIQKNTNPTDFDAWCSLDREKCENFDDFVFCHKFCFCATFKTKESAISAVCHCRKDYKPVLS